MDLSDIRNGFIGQQQQHLQLIGDVFERHALQFRAPFEGLHKQAKSRLTDGLAAFRQSV